mmetsp:Transcript_20830/g.51076  ORF Transcript_20830/g.51076 Transcript_20830/m.51076 type:complete len:125 (-) Transcript_20830:103-477(-)
MSTKLGLWSTFASLSSQSAGDRVRVVGKIVKIEEGEAILESDNKQVKILKPNVANYSNTRFVEIFGELKDPTAEIPSIEEEKSISFGEKFNLGHFNKMVELSKGPFNSLFVSSSVESNAMETEG